MKLTRVRQATGEASSSSSSSAEHEEQQQPRVSAGAPNISKDSRQQKSKTNRGKKGDICTLLVHLCPKDTWSNEAQESEKEEEQPQQVSARVPTLRRNLGQPPNAIILCLSRRRRPAGWPTGVQSGLPPRPDLSAKPDLPARPDLHQNLTT